MKAIPFVGLWTKNTEYHHQNLNAIRLCRKFRIKWPWEQDRQMAIYNRSSDLIQLASQPDQPMMDMRAGIKDWCLSHLPGSGDKFL